MMALVGDTEDRSDAGQRLTLPSPGLCPPAQGAVSRRSRSSRRPTFDQIFKNKLPRQERSRAHLLGIPVRMGRRFPRNPNAGPANAHIPAYSLRHCMPDVTLPRPLRHEFRR